MGKTAVISDIHSNIYALEAVLQDIQKRKNIDEIICLGDVVGYYPYPNECIDLVKENCSLTLLGNHDAGVIQSEPQFCFNPTAWEMIVYTQENITKKNYDWLTSLPRKRVLEKNKKKMYLVHGSPFSTFDYFHANSKKSYISMLEEAYEKIKTNFLMVGHTHMPVIVKTKKITFVNPGAVGQPRHGVPGANYAIVDLSSSKATLIHLDYDFSPLQEHMKKLKLPKSLIDRLDKGI